MGLSSNHRSRVVLFFTLLTVMLQTACGPLSQTGADGTGVLPPPPPGQLKTSGYEPQNPYSQLVPGLLTRTLHRAATREGYRIEVRDLLVGPRQSASGASLPGAGVIEVRSGNGVITTGGKGERMQAGSTFSLAEGERLAIENQGDTPIALRVHVFIAD